MIPPLLAIFTWPLAGLIFFKKLPIQQAMIWVIVAGYLLLPEKGQINLPVLPTISKATMPTFIAAIFVMVVAKDYFSKRNRVVITPQTLILPGWIPQHPVMRILFIGLIVGEVLTVLTNGDRLVYGPRVLQGLSLYDAGSRVLVALVMLLPMLLARKCLATPEQHKTLVFAMLIAGLLYSLPTLWEVRMSPQLNVQIYGLKLEAWIQHVRNGGFRPLVFLHHGLWLAIFMAMSTIAAVAYIRLAEPSNRMRAILASVWLLGTLTLMNSLGGLLIALLLVIPVFFLTSRIQMLIAAGLVGVVLLYPMMRGAGLIPIERALSMAEQINPARAQSLGYRLRNEDVLLEKAQQRPLFGWGSWGRNQVFNEQGQDVSVTDGRWVIEIGSNGWIGYLTRFGLLCVPVIILALQRRRYPTDTATAAVIMMMTANLLDLIPNATLTPITWLLAGALVGRLEYSASMTSQTETSSKPAGTVRSGGARRRDHTPAPTAQQLAAKSMYTRQKTTHHRQQKGRNKHG